MSWWVDPHELCVKTSWLRCSCILNTWDLNPSSRRNRLFLLSFFIFLSCGEPQAASSKAYPLAQPMSPIQWRFPPSPSSSTSSSESWGTVKQSLGETGLGHPTLKNVAPKWDVSTVESCWKMPKSTNSLKLRSQPSKQTPSPSSCRNPDMTRDMIGSPNFGEFRGQRAKFVETRLGRACFTVVSSSFQCQLPKIHSSLARSQQI